MQVKTFARRINPDALSALAELFLVNGDMSAWLYTGSQAMHSERILLFEPETSKLRKAGVGMYGNIMVSTTRGHLWLMWGETDYQGKQRSAPLYTRVCRWCDLALTRRLGYLFDACIHKSDRCMSATIQWWPWSCFFTQVGIKRRYNNVLVDTDKQQQIEMFLGMKHSVYFPAVKLYYKVSRPGASTCSAQLMSMPSCFALLVHFPYICSTKQTQALCLCHHPNATHHSYKVCC
jgi:hypothetical protein